MGLTCAKISKHYWEIWVGPSGIFHEVWNGKKITFRSFPFLPRGAPDNKCLFAARLQCQFCLAISQTPTSPTLRTQRMRLQLVVPTSLFSWPKAFCETSFREGAPRCLLASPSPFSTQNKAKRDQSRFIKSLAFRKRKWSAWLLV